MDKGKDDPDFVFFSLKSSFRLRWEQQVYYIFRWKIEFKLNQESDQDSYFVFMKKKEKILFSSPSPSTTFCTFKKSGLLVRKTTTIKNFFWRVVRMVSPNDPR